MTNVPPAPPQHPVPRHPDGVRIPLLLSGIFNTFAALAWASTCIFAVVGIPLLVLAIFEFKAFLELGRGGPYAPMKGRVQTLGILEICTILTFNLLSMICGIIVLAQMATLDDDRPA